VFGWDWERELSAICRPRLSYTLQNVGSFKHSSVRHWISPSVYLS
jgi:hypothetical protein